MSGCPLSLSAEVENLFREKMKEFLAWAAVEWTVSDKDRHDEVFGRESDDHIAGYNAGIASMPGALECWLEEFPT